MIPDGFYAGYMSGEGYGVVLFVFRQGTIVGVDGGGVKFDGFYRQDPDNKNFEGTISIDAPPNIDLVQGVNTGQNGIRYDVPLVLPPNFMEAPFISVSTPFGQVNVKLEKLRDLGSVG